MQNDLVRLDGRKADTLRPVAIDRGINRYAEGSALISWGNTQVICTASVEEKVPSFLRGTGSGWVTAEYGMLPRSTHTRTMRDSTRGRPSGRSSEIQRLIGRSLRASVDLLSLGERTIWIDCDVVQADGGTRTAAITGAFVALADALRTLREREVIPLIPIKTFVAAVSVGKVEGNLLLDLCYEEDSRAEIDCNVVLTGAERLVELQLSGEAGTCDRFELNTLLDLATEGIRSLLKMQKEVLGFSREEVALFAPSDDPFCQ